MTNWVPESSKKTGTTGTTGTLCLDSSSPILPFRAERIVLHQGVASCGAALFFDYSIICSQMVQSCGEMVLSVHK